MSLHHAAGTHTYKQKYVKHADDIWVRSKPVHSYIHTCIHTGRHTHTYTCRRHLSSFQTCARLFWLHRKRLKLLTYVHMYKMHRCTYNRPCIHKHMYQAHKHTCAHIAQYIFTYTHMYTYTYRCTYTWVFLSLHVAIMHTLTWQSCTQPPHHVAIMHILTWQSCTQTTTPRGNHAHTHVAVMHTTTTTWQSCIYSRGSHAHATWQSCINPRGRDFQMYTPWRWP